MKSIQDTLTLSNGVKMPQFGYGTFRMQDKDSTITAIQTALETGYRLIDTAAIYGNEKIVGEAIATSSVNRDEIFLVSKLWNSEHGYDETIKAFEASLKDLQTDYLDLYLIHWPKEKNVESWKAMEHLYKEGKIKAIGVSNFKIHHLKEIMDACDIVPMVNQVELHPQFPQDELKAFCDEHNMPLMAWGPLMQGAIFEKEVMKEIAEKHGKNIADVAIRWSLDRGVIAIPKSVNPERIVNNAKVFDFELDEEDMKKITTLNTGERIGPDPDHIIF